jgi:hypothetical protein
MLVGCNHAPTTPASTPTPTIPTSSDLQRALLSTTDLPSGWSVLATADRNSLSTSPCAASILPPRHVEATVVFQQPDAQLELFETIAAFDSGTAKQWMDALQQFTDCQQTRNVSIQGTPSTVKSDFAPLPLASIGDQTLALHVNSVTTQPGTPSSDAESGDTDLVYVRVGDDVVQIWNYRVSNAGAISTTSIVEKAVDKLKSSG